jgi:hypothetical protein
VKRGFSGPDWELEDCASLARANPKTFEVPAPHEATLVRLGDLLRLHFRITDPGIAQDPSSPRAERMWVEVCQLADNGIFLGHLTNTPAFITSLDPGDVIAFTWPHVGQVHVTVGDPRHPDTRT